MKRQNTQLVEDLNVANNEVNQLESKISEVSNNLQIKQKEL